MKGFPPHRGGTMYPDAGAFDRRHLRNNSRLTTTFRRDSTICRTQDSDQELTGVRNELVFSALGLSRKRLDMVMSLHYSRSHQGCVQVSNHKLAPHEHRERK